MRMSTIWYSPTLHPFLGLRNANLCRTWWCGANPSETISRWAACGNDAGIASLITYGILSVRWRNPVACALWSCRYSTCCRLIVCGGNSLRVGILWDRALRELQTTRCGDWRRGRGSGLFWVWTCAVRLKLETCLLHASYIVSIALVRPPNNW